MTEFDTGVRKQGVVPSDSAGLQTPADSAASARPRETTQIASLNGLRAVSVIMVVASHLATAISTPPSIAWGLKAFNGYLFDGALGVRVFFCISGFLITHLLLSERDKTGSISLKNFYLRRALRIWPVFYAFVLFLYIVNETTALKVSTCQFVTALTFTKNYGCSSWIDGHLWSLAVEQQFYLLWPAVLAFLSIRGATGVAIVAILIAPLSRLFEARTGFPQWWLTSHCDALLTGGLAAMARQFHRDLFDHIAGARALAARYLSFALLVAPVVWRQASPDAALQITLGPTTQALAATFLIVSFAYGPAGIIKTFLNLWPLNFLGLVSYSLYIWQEPFFIWPSDFGFDRLLTFEWPFNLVCMLIVATASYYGLERPLVSLRRRLSAARKH